MLPKDKLLRFIRAREQLRSVGHAAPSIDEIAKEAAMSRFHFARRFKALFGDTPAQLRTRARLETAKELLVESNHSVTDICTTVGFSSLGSFSTLFARRFGRAPSEYRREIRAAQRARSPDCLTLLRAAWAQKAQVSRSEITTDPVS